MPALRVCFAYASHSTASGCPHVVLKPKRCMRSRLQGLVGMEGQHIQARVKRRLRRKRVQGLSALPASSEPVQAMQPQPPLPTWRRWSIQSRPPLRTRRHRRGCRSGSRWGSIRWLEHCCCDIQDSSLWLATARYNRQLTIVASSGGSRRCLPTAWTHVELLTHTPNPSMNRIHLLRVELFVHAPSLLIGCIHGGQEALRDLPAAT